MNAVCNIEVLVFERAPDGSLVLAFGDPANDDRLTGVIMPAAEKPAHPSVDAPGVLRN
jgi:hypothetical protein